jgi:RNA-directed DNA polymerase
MKVLKDTGAKGLSYPSYLLINYQKWEELKLSKTKSFCISKKSVMAAWERVKENKGTYGVDLESLEDFEENLKDNLYKLWNRMSSGSYFPPAVRGIEIPKRDGGKTNRLLSIPTVSDRVAQAVVKSYLEPIVEPIFHTDSYGYRSASSKGWYVQ